MKSDSSSDYGQTSATYDDSSTSVDGWDYLSILDSLSSYDWSSEFPERPFSIGGISQ